MTSVKEQIFELPSGVTQLTPDHGPFSIHTERTYGLYNLIARQPHPGFPDFYARQLEDAQRFRPDPFKAPAELPEGLKENPLLEVWQNLAMQVHKAGHVMRKEGVFESGYEVSVREDQLGILLHQAVEELFVSAGQSVPAATVDTMTDSCKEIIKSGWGPLRADSQKHDGETVYIFRSSDKKRNQVMYYYLLSSYFLRGNPDIPVLLGSLEKAGMFEEGSELRYYQFYSLLVQSVFRRPAETDETDVMKSRALALERLLHGIVDKYGESEGLALCIVLIEEMEKQAAQPGLYRIATGDFTTHTIGGAELQKQLLEPVLLTSIKQSLAERYFRFAYKNRREIIPVAAINTASDNMEHGNPSACFEEIFRGSGAWERLEKLVLSRSKDANTATIEVAKKRRKVEAGMIPLFADILGYDPKLTAEMAAYMQVLWGSVIVPMDDAIDRHEARDGEPTIGALRGRSEAIAIPLSAMLNTIRSLVKRHNAAHPGLVESVTAMLDEVYEGDLLTRNLGWDEVNQLKIQPYDIEEYLKGLRTIASIFSWFAQSAGGEVGLDNVGMELAGVARNIGCLILIDNDFEDLLSDGHKHETGNDIGQKVTLPLWAFLRLAAKDDSGITQAEKEFVTKYVIDIRLKRLSGETLALEDKEKIDYIVDTVRKHLPAIVTELDNFTKEFFLVGKAALAQAGLALSGRGIMDERNSKLLHIMDQYLELLWNKIMGYRSLNPAG